MRHPTRTPKPGPDFRKINWLRLESQINDILRTAASYGDNPSADASDLAEMLIRISEEIAGETGRPSPLNDPVVAAQLLTRFPPRVSTPASALHETPRIQDPQDWLCDETVRPSARRQRWYSVSLNAWCWRSIRWVDGSPVPLPHEDVDLYANAEGTGEPRAETTIVESRWRQRPT